MSNPYKSTTGVGIITCDREDFLQNLLKFPFDDVADEVIIFNSGSELTNPVQYEVLSDSAKSGNTSVGKAKNELLRNLKLRNVEHIFLLEDDISIKDPDVFRRYIDSAYTTGIYHFNFHKHGPNNRNVDGTSKITNTINYDENDVELTFHPHVLGAFSYYHSATIGHVGYLDEQFVNAMEHVDHSYRIAQKGFSTAFGWWCDISGSEKMLDDQDPEHAKSAIRKDEKWMKHFADAIRLFEQKHGFKPQLPKVLSEQEILAVLEEAHATNACPDKIKK